MKIWIKIIIGIVVGSLIGLAYYYFVGCNGTCPLTSTWYIPTLYGAFFGLIITIPSKSRKKQNGAKD